MDGSFLDEALCHGMDRNEPDLVALALDPKMHHALTALYVRDLETAELLTTDPVIEQGCENGAIANALDRVRRRSLEKFAGLRIAKRGVEPSSLLAIGRLTPSTGLPVTALRSQR
jgi:hypothetical protein